MDCTKPIRIKSASPQGLVVPCGKCLACRISYRRQWSLRLWHELSYWDSATFATLTYDDYHLPDNGSLVKSHLQLYFKRLRKALDGRQIKYYACGEYGDISDRPHYHAIVFGLAPYGQDRDMMMDAWHACDWSVEAIKRNSFSYVTPERIDYVCSYINKKLSGDMLDEVYTSTGRENVFRLCSNGLGSRFADDNSETISSNACLSRNGVKQSVPRYYVTRLGLDLKDTARNLELEHDRMYNAIGLHVTDEEAYNILCAEEYRRYDDKRKESNRQRDRNLQAKVNLRRKPL